MKETAIELSKELRDPEGEHRVEVVIALTHCRVPNVSPWLSGKVVVNDWRTLELELDWWVGRISSWRTSLERCRGKRGWRMSMGWIF